MISICLQFDRKLGYIISYKNDLYKKKFFLYNTKQIMWQDKKHKPEAALNKIKLHTYKKVLFRRRSFLYKIIYISLLFSHIYLSGTILKQTLASVQLWNLSQNTGA